MLNIKNSLYWDRLNIDGYKCLAEPLFYRQVFPFWKLYGRSFLMEISLSDLTIREIELFVLASKTQSLREVSRQSGLLPGHVSKIMKRLEVKMNQKLFIRSAQGVSLTPEGLELLEIARKVSELAQGFSPSRNNEKNREKLSTIGSISFITTNVLAPRIAIWKKSIRNTRFRLIEFTHNDLVAQGLKGAFELAVHIEKLEWTQSWESYSLGKLKWKLYGRAGHPLGQHCSERQVSHYPFVVPSGWSPSGYYTGEDFCPLSPGQREKGDEASTAETALRLCVQSDQVTYVPEVLAESFNREKSVSEISVKGWPQVKKEIFLSVKTDVVSKRLVEFILRELHL